MAEGEGDDEALEVHRRAEPTLADAILDRLVHQSHRIDLKLSGESMRKNRATADAGASPRPDGR